MDVASKAIGTEPASSLTAVAARPELRRWQRRVALGTALFEQGQTADSAFVVLEGIVRLVGDRDGVGFSEGIEGPGEILGERVLTETAPYPRRYGAIAQTDVVVLEIPREEFRRFERENTPVANALYRAALAVTQMRLQRMHFLVRALRPIALDRRVAGLVGYFHRTMATVGKAAAIEINASAIAEYVEIEAAEAEQWLEKLEGQGVLRRDAMGTYHVTDISALHDLQEKGFGA
jgi:CRP-like cAMP-binding protein